MHITALAMIIFRYHENDHIKNLLRRVNPEKLVGTSVHSDPATGNSPLMLNLVVYWQKIPF